MYQYTVVDPQKLAKNKASNLLEEKKVKSRIKHKDDIISGKIPQYEKGARRDGIKKWVKEKGIKYATCPKCKLPMNSHMAEMQVKNKREGGVECMACIMGTKRKI